MAGGGMLTPPRGLGGPTDQIAQQMAPQVGAGMGQGLPPGADQLLAPTRGGIGPGRAMPLGSAELSAPPSLTVPTAAGVTRTPTVRPGFQPLGGIDTSQLPPGLSGAMGGSASPGSGGLSPEVMAMVDAALAGGPPQGATPGVGPAVPPRGGVGMQAPPLRPVPVPAHVAPPLGMPTAPPFQDPRIAASMNRVLGPIQGGFAGGASPELQRRWALHAQNLQEGTQR